MDDKWKEIWKKVSGLIQGLSSYLWWSGENHGNLSQRKCLGRNLYWALPKYRCM